MKKFEVLKVTKNNEVTVNVEVKIAGKKSFYTRSYKKTPSGSWMTKVYGHNICFDLESGEIISVDKISDTKKLSGKYEVTIPEVNPELPKIEDVVKVKQDGPIKHEKYQDIKDCLECDIPVYLAGPAGSGKNFTVEQIAKELGWDFYFSNSIQQEYKLTGFIDAGGEFHETEFFKACTSGKDCVFFLDELDASVPEVLVLLNAAIANGYFEFPTGRVNFDKVHFVAAGNTVGSGADEMYTGRMVLDQATLDRFAIIEFDYDYGVEYHITNGNTDLIQFIHKMREISNLNGIRATYSYRCMSMVVKLEAKGKDLATILKMTVFKGMDKDTINTIQATGSNRYFEALKKIQMAA